MGTDRSELEHEASPCVSIPCQQADRPMPVPLVRAHKSSISASTDTETGQQAAGQDQGAGCVRASELREKTAQILSVCERKPQCTLDMITRDGKKLTVWVYESTSLQLTDDKTIKIFGPGGRRIVSWQQRVICCHVLHQIPKFPNCKKCCGRTLGRPGRSRTRSGDGKGWDVTGARIPVCQRAETVAGAVRGSPSATHTFGSDCDCRFTKR